MTNSMCSINLYTQTRKKHPNMMLSLQIHTSERAEQRGLSWMGFVCLCEATGSSVGLAENLRPCGCVVVVSTKKCLARLDGGGAIFPEYSWND